MKFILVFFFLLSFFCAEFLLGILALFWGMFKGVLSSDDNKHTPQAIQEVKDVCLPKIKAIAYWLSTGVR